MAAAEATRVETEARLHERRDLIAAGHGVIQEAYANNWDYETVAQDIRFVRVARHLSTETRTLYELHGGPQLRIKRNVGRTSHAGLQADVDRLAREWNLFLIRGPRPSDVQAARNGATRGRGAGAQHPVLCMGLRGVLRA